MTRRSRAAGVLGVVAVCLGAAVSRAATADQIDAAIARGQDFLLNRPAFGRSGHWEDADKRGDGGDGPSTLGPQWGGRTALCTYALLASGKSPNDPKLKKPIDFLRRADIIGYYALGLRPQVWLYLPRTPENREAIMRDFKLLWAGVEKDPRKKDTGLYDYTLQDRERIDLSVSQYGVLGMWACAQMEMEVPAGDFRKNQPNFWNLVETKWRSLQDKTSSGWAYGGAGTSSPSMTAAGIATLYITQEYLHARDGLTCAGNITYPEIDKAIAFLAKALPDLVRVGGDSDLYTLYGIERIGVAGGIKYLGNIDWYKAGADYLVKAQNPNGSWSDRNGDEVSTSFALLFLSRGREPVMMNKIKYDLARPRGEKVEGFWNQRARDVANAARYVGKQTERSLNWQSLDLGVCTVDDLHDAPIAWISGAQALTLEPEQVAKLKQYVEEGGTLVFNTDCNRRPFSAAVGKMLKDMWPGYELRALERDSVVLSKQQFKASSWRAVPDAKALSNGVREIAFVLDDDAGKTLQTNEVTVRGENFQLVADIYQYAIDKTHAQVKGRTHVVRGDVSIATTSAVKIARLMYAGNCDPEPAGWRRMAAILRNKHKIDAQVTSVQLGKDALDGYAMAHLTGVGPVTLTPEQVQSLKAFVDAGGLLVIDAAGGDAKFVSSMGGQLAKILPAANAEGGELLQSTDSLYTAGGLPQPKIQYRLFRNAIGDESTKPSLHGAKNAAGRWGVLFSADDLSAGLVGNHVDGIRGYTPETATDLMTRIVRYAMK